MKVITKTMVTLSLLLPLAGCWDFECCKKNQEPAKSEVAAHGPVSEKASKCSHKGCTHDHSKDAQPQAHDEVKTQSMDDEYDDNNNDDDVITQGMDDDDYSDYDMNNLE